MPRASTREDSALSASRSSLAVSQLRGAAPIASEGIASPFALIDEIAQSPTEYGVLVTHLRAAAMAPLARHLRRCAELAGRQVLVAGQVVVADVWREVSLGLRVSDTLDPAPLARRIAHAASGMALVVIERRSTSWGRAVAEELERIALEPEHRLLLVLLRPEGKRSWLTQPRFAQSPETDAVVGAGAGAGAGADTDHAPRNLTLELDTLSSLDARRWWEAIVACGELQASVAASTIESLDAWWESARARPMAPASLPASLSETACELWSHVLRAEQGL